MTTKHLIRRIIAKAVATQGYRVSGNLIFSAVQWERLERGQYSTAVSERPVAHGPRIVRFAELLSLTTKTVILTVELKEDEAAALAQFVKRAHFGTVEQLSDPSNKAEPQLMMNAICKVQRALREVGYAPR